MLKVICGVYYLGAGLNSGQRYGYSSSHSPLLACMLRIVICGYPPYIVLLANDQCFDIQLISREAFALVVNDLNVVQ